ncbi:MAG TPA: hypothetical protein PKM41_12880 [Deltaproteobacteria bacterium]|jgi:hypothetical protein|nr:hypothetical protein [Deltaproteobacteria bacterium]HOI07898.1 hypothetical protein [Deltaproteobacteria bacterium]
MIEKIPFIHRDKLYYIIIHDDITFTALHDILDTLIDQGAFLGEPEDPALFTVMYEKVKYTVGVDGIDVMIDCS